MVEVLSVLDLVGWVGGGATVVAYVLVSTRRWAPDATAFQLANMIGGALLATASFSRGALPSACLNLIWIGFSAQVLGKVLLRRRRVRVVPASAPVAEPVAERVDAGLTVAVAA